MGKLYSLKIGKRTIKVRKLPKVIYAINRQTGKRLSLKRDRSRKALPPGKRISKSGRIYYEYKRNRSDKKGKRI